MAELSEAVDRTLETLGMAHDTPAFDAWLAAAVAADALDGEGPWLFRAGRELDGAQSGYAAVPEPPLWVRVGADGEVAVCAVGGDDVTEARATALRLETRTEVCCDSPKCDKQRSVARLWMDLDDDSSLLFGEALDGAALKSLGVKLAERLAIELDGDAVEHAAEPLDAAPMSAHALAPWALRREGDLFVLRDHASRGPREAAASELVACVVLCLGAVAAWVTAVSAYGTESWQTMIISIAIGFVLTLAGFAMSQIWLHSYRYRANSEALLYAAQDRLVVAPWHSRSGAVDVKPEGRYGAALRIDEVERIEVVPEDAGWTLRAQSSHGPMDIGTLETQEQADAWQKIVTRLTAGVAHVSLALLAMACSPAPSPHPAPPSTAQPTAVASASVSGSAGVPSPEAPDKLTIIGDDVPKAMAKAKAENKVVFVDVWAPWCHTCVSMHNFVLPDPSLLPLRKRIVFAAVDSDRPENTAFMDRYAVNVWPTLFVIDPKDGAVLGLWQGSASVTELRKFLIHAADARDGQARSRRSARGDARRQEGARGRHVDQGCRAISARDQPRRRRVGASQ